MKKLALSLLAFITFAVSFGIGVPQTYAAYSFGRDPYTDVINAASSHAPNIGLPPYAFAAIILAPTWPEVADGNGANTPSPMTMGRSDVSGAGQLYYNGITGPNTPYPSAFFHAGVGAWQLDSAGLGSALSTNEQVNTTTAATFVADWIQGEWNSCGSFCTDDQWRRAYVWRSWAACGSWDYTVPGSDLASHLKYNNKCNDIYKALWSSSVPGWPNSLDISTNTSVGRLGGAYWTTCNYISDPTTFSCLRVNPFQAQGYTGSWVFSPYSGNWNAAGNPTLNPLTNSMITFKGSDGYDYRNWLKENNGSYGVNIYADLPLGQDARLGTTWSTYRLICVAGRCS